MKWIVSVLIFSAAMVANAKTIEVKMLNSGKDGSMVFEPAFLQVSVGDSVKFVPTDVSHSSQSTLVPTGAKAWNGKPDQALTVKLDKEGVYVYQCQPHAMMAMVGVIQVGKPTNLDAVKKEADRLSTTFVMNKDRLKKYIGQVQ